MGCGPKGEGTSRPASSNARVSINFHAPTRLCIAHLPHPFRFEASRVCLPRQSHPLGGAKFKNYETHKKAFDSEVSCWFAPSSLEPNRFLRSHGRGRDCGGHGVNDDVEALAGAWRDEIAREQIVGLIAYLVRVFAVRVPLK